MIVNFCTLREKDVVNVCDGRKLGTICDFSIDTECGKLCEIFVSERFLALAGGKNTLKIGWEQIVCIGEDAILVNIGQIPRSPDGGEEGKKSKRGGLFFG